MFIYALSIALYYLNDLNALNAYLYSSIIINSKFSYHLKYYQFYEKIPHYYHWVYFKQPYVTNKNCMKVSVLNT